MSTKRAVCVIVLVAVVVSDLVAGVIYSRILESKKRSDITMILSYVEKEKRIRVRNNLYHHDLRPNSEADAMVAMQPYKIRTNSLGFKDHGAREVKLNSDRQRVLIIGDSFTEGHGLEYKDTFPALLDKRLPDVEVLNAGVLSYSPTVFSRKIAYLREGLGLQFDHVIAFVDLSDPIDELNYYIGDDGELHSKYDDKVERKPLEPGLLADIADYSLLTRTGLLVYNNFAPGGLPEPIYYSINQDRERAAWTNDREVFQKQKVSEGLAKATAEMSSLHSYLSELEVQLTVVIYPWPYQIYHSDLGGTHTEAWTSWASEHRVPLLNFFPTFIDSGTPAKEIIQKYYIPYDVHWNRAGHEVIAQSLHAYFDEGYSANSKTIPSGP